ncbi:MAG TPA: NAD(P)H-binding protein [Aquamicrobium sp.]|nr:NAD(P)H-binding protein [Aquamicrobium sp.]
MTVTVIFGARTGVGFHLARLMRARGEPVVAMLRPGTDAGPLEALGVRVCRGDAFSGDDIDAALDLAGEGEAGGEFDVVSTVGGRREDGRFADEGGNVNVVDRAARRDLGRLVLITSIGCGEMAPYRSERAIAAFGASVDAKTRAENHARRVVPSATFIRPGGLRSEPATGRGILSDDPQIHGFIHREDVADLIARALRDPATQGRAFAAVDADQARSANPIEPFPLAR